eukprot:419248_1
MLQVVITLIIIITSVSESTNCDHTYFNQDFEYGTVRIKQSGTYCLGENISMNPRKGSWNNPNEMGAWFPINDNSFPGCVNHENGGWALGFFAGISIEISDVTIDLQGYKFEMSKPFYLQQRWFNIIEIQNTAFNFGEGPTNFGQTINRIQNICIRNGILGRSSHNGIHGFDVVNVHISDLRIHTFEVAGIQMNGFKDVTIRNVDIGPSSTQVPFWGYYSHGRFSLNGFELIKTRHDKYVRFNGNRLLTVQQIYDNLKHSLDIAYRWQMGLSTDEDKKDPLYEISIKMFENKFGVPDGSAIYGMIFNSRGIAVQGFGDSPNDNDFQGNILKIDNVNIHGLQLNMNEIPAVYFDRCEGFYYNKEGKKSITPILGRFGDVFDIRRACPLNKWDYIDKGFYSYHDLQYYGNPLADAQVALIIFRENHTPSHGNKTFVQWATANPYTNYNSLPYCARFVCNADAMFHTNKGLIGIRFDGIENVMIKKLTISDLFNESPLGSLACGKYSGPSNGGQPKGLEKEGFMGTDIRGISIINGGNVELYDIQLKNFVSNNGDVIGIHIMDEGGIYVHDVHKIVIDDLEAGATITQRKYYELKYNGLNPYPNNFYVCNIRAEKLSDREYYNYPHLYTSYGEGFIYPPGAIVCKCYELFYDAHGERRRRLIKYDY